MLRVSAASRNSSRNSVSEAYAGKGSPLQRALQKSRNPDTDFSACVAIMLSIVDTSPHGPAASQVTTALTCKYKCTCEQPAMPVLLNYMHAYHDTGYYQPPVPCADIMHAGHTSCLPARHSPGAVTAAQTVPLHEAVTGTYDWQDWHIQVPRIRHAPFLEKRRKHLAARAFGLDCKLSSCL